MLQCIDVVLLHDILPGRWTSGVNERRTLSDIHSFIHSL